MHIHNRGASQTHTKVENEAPWLPERTPSPQTGPPQQS